MTRARPVEVPLAHGPALAADLTLPSAPVGLIAFAHGSGSGRHSPRNRQVAATLQAAGLGTLLLDLLTPAEEREDERTRALRFDISLLAGRLEQALEWLAREPATRDLPVGLFGASTGAAAALIAAARRPQAVAAVVSRGGRPDLAGESLRQVRAPTLLLVGGLDEEVLRLNRAAKACIPARCELVVVPGATHLFPEPGKLESAARLAREWFLEHLVEVEEART